MLPNGLGVKRDPNLSLIIDIFYDALAITDCYNQARPRGHFILTSTIASFKRRFPLLLAACFFLATSAYPQRQVARDPGVVAALKVLDTWLGGTVRRRQLPSLSIAIVYDQEIVWEKVYGDAPSGALYPFGGGYRTFDALALLQLRNEGKLSLDDSVDMHLPWFRIKNPSSTGLTIRHLMLNTSGLARHIPGTNLNGLTVPSRLDMIRQAGETVAISAPGSKVAFSHLGGAPAHEIIAAVSGQPDAPEICPVSVAVARYEHPGFG